MRRVIIYSTSHCPYCQLAKEFLTKKGVAFEEKNVETDLNSRNELIQKSGQLAVPVIEIDGKLIIGFSADEIEKALD
ncbi:MAG: glutathione S-transferase N-terminal domain-containing protein [Patescibacteria group bacterium]|nr:glutathione S-transferase N-terminal domain-containing protein [Patescibacteria group bacterium]